MTSTISFTWTRSESDYVRALLLNHGRLRAVRLMTRWLMPAVVVGLLLYLVLFGADKIFVSLGSAFVVVVLLHFGTRWWGLPRHARRVYRQQKSLQQPVTIEIDERGLRASSGKDDSTFLPWAEVHRWLEGPHDFLIYPSEAIFHMVPKEELSAEQIASLRQLLEDLSLAT